MKGTTKAGDKAGATVTVLTPEQREHLLGIVIGAQHTYMHAMVNAKTPEEREFYMQRNQEAEALWAVLTSKAKALAMVDAEEEEDGEEDQDQDGEEEGQ